MKIRRRRLMLCREGFYYLAVLGFVSTGALMRDINLLIVVAGMLIGPLIYNVRAVFVSLRSLDVRRKLPKAICAGDLLVVTLAVDNHKRRKHCWAIAVDDRVQREGRRGRANRATAGVLFAHVPAAGSAQRSYHGRLMRRGRYRFGPLRISTRFPLGLVRRTLTVDAPGTMFVYPRLGRLTRSWHDLLQASDLGSQRARQRRGSMEGEFYGLRDWRQGDGRRLIHWRTSARRASLVVRQFEQQRNEDLILLLDLWQPPSASDRQREVVEQAVRFAATAVNDTCLRGGSHLFLGFAGSASKVISGPASMGMLEEALESLALLAPAEKNGLDELFRQGVNQSRSGATVVILTTRRLDPAVVERWRKVPEKGGIQLATRKVEIISVGDDRVADFYVDDVESTAALTGTNGNAS